MPASAVCAHLCYLIYFLQWVWQVKIVILVLDKENISLRLFIGLIQSFTSSCVTRSLLIPSNFHYFSLKGHNWDRLWEFPLLTGEQILSHSKEDHFNSQDCIMTGWPPLARNNLFTSCKIQAQAELLFGRNVMKKLRFIWRTGFSI